MLILLLFIIIIIIIRDVFELYRYRVANLTSCSELMSESDPLAKNRIEFQWGSKQPGTSSEALILPCSSLNTVLQSRQGIVAKPG